MRIWPDSRLSRKGLKLGMQTVTIERHWTSCKAIAAFQIAKVKSVEAKALLE
jgi:hypothetical protein